MKMKTFQFTTDQGWTLKSFPEWDSENTLVLIFAAPEFVANPAPIKELCRHYPHSKIIGCSSAGEILGTQVSDQSISVAIVRFEKTPLEIISVQINDATESSDVGKKIAEFLNKEDLQGIFVLSDGLGINGSELANGLNTTQNQNLVITGGLAGDGSEFKQTWTIFNGELQFKSIVAVGFYGEFVQLGYGSQGGWDIFGPTRRITRSKDNILYELDGKPALALYKQYLGEKGIGLPATGLLFPLAIRKDDLDKKNLVRTILSVDEATQSLAFAGDMPIGYLAQLMHSNFDHLIAGANSAGKQTKDNHPILKKADSSILLIAISCVGRRLLLGERSEEEVESTLEIFPKGTEQVGFYSYGELSSLTKGKCELHNQTMTLTSISEEVCDE